MAELFLNPRDTRTVERQPSVPAAPGSPSAYSVAWLIML
jgi:hypothetical protein